MEVVCSNNLYAHLLSNVDKHARKLLVGNAAISCDAMILNLNVKVARCKSITESLGPLHRTSHVSTVNAFGNDARDTRAGANKAISMTTQVIEGNARLVIKAIHSRLRNGLHQVDVALLVLCQQNHVVELGLAIARQRVVRREIHLAAKDGLDYHRRLKVVDIALFVPASHVFNVLSMSCRIFLGVGLYQLIAATLLKKRLIVAPSLVLWRVVVYCIARKAQVGHAIHVAVISNGYCRHTKLYRSIHHVFNARSAVKHRKDSVVMQMYKCHKLMCSSCSSRFACMHCSAPHGREHSCESWSRKPHSLFGKCRMQNC